MRDEEVLRGFHLEGEGTTVVTIGDKQICSLISRGNPHIHSVEVQLYVGANQILSTVNGEQWLHEVVASGFEVV